MICNLGDPMSLRHPVHVYVWYIWKELDAAKDTENIWEFLRTYENFWEHMRISANIWECLQDTVSNLIGARCSKRHKEHMWISLWNSYMHTENIGEFLYETLTCTQRTYENFSMKFSYVYREYMRISARHGFWNLIAARCRNAQMSAYYGLATISRPLQITCFFCRIYSFL